jgi:hypothetical protein
MEKHGLANDLKKLDSFNQFIERHSPHQTRENSCGYLEDGFETDLIVVGGGSYCENFKSPLNNKKFKRVGSGDIKYNSNGLNDDIVIGKQEIYSKTII